MEQEKIEELASLLELVANDTSSEGLRRLARKVTNYHHTNQQTLMREFIIPLIKLWAIRDTTDPRFRATIELAKELKPVIEQAYIPFI